MEIIIIISYHTRILSISVTVCRSGGLILTGLLGQLKRIWSMSWIENPQSHVVDVAKPHFVKLSRVLPTPDLAWLRVHHSFLPRFDPFGSFSFGTGMVGCSGPRFSFSLYLFIL